MDARTLEVLHKRRYPGSLLTVRGAGSLSVGTFKSLNVTTSQGARLKEINEIIAALPDPTFRKLLADIRDGITESISLYLNEFDIDSFTLFVEVL
jgi:hypothetical protein